MEDKYLFLTYCDFQMIFLYLFFYIYLYLVSLSNCISSDENNDIISGLEMNHEGPGR